jgi:hypothetical protein
LESGTVKKLAEKIFICEPLQNDTVQLLLDECDSHYVSELMFSLLNEGIQIMFGKNISEMIISEITDENINIINDRLKAVCFKVYVDKRLYTELPYKFIDGNKVEWFNLGWDYIYPNKNRPDIPSICEYIYRISLEDGEVALCFENIKLANATETCK